METVWFISAISLWFLALLSAPWFVPPKDAIISAIGALLILTTMETSQFKLLGTTLENIRLWSIIYAAVITVFATTALVSYDKDKRSNIGRFAYKITSIFGRGEILFTAPAIISILASYQLSFENIGWMLLYWILIVVGKPVERLFSAIRQLREEGLEASKQPTVGAIGRIDHPNIVRVKLTSMQAWKPNRLFTASMPDGTQRYVVSLFSQIQGSDVMGTGLCVAKLQEPIQLPSGMVCASHDEQKTADFLEKHSGAIDSKLIGFIVENSSIGVVSFEVSATSALSEGDVVFVRINGKDIFYQIVGARVSDLLCMSNLVHASPTKEHDNNDNIKRTTGRAA